MRDKKKVLIFLIPAVLLVCIACALGMLFPHDKIADGVFARGVELSGMTRSEAVSAVRKIKENDEDLTFYTMGGTAAELSREEIGISRNVEKTVDEAFSYGRGKNFFAAACELISLRMSPIDIGCAYTYDREKLNEFIYNFGVSVNGEYKSYILEYGDETVTVRRGNGGQSKDTRIALAMAEAAIKRGCVRIFLKLDAEPAPKPNLRSLYDATYLEPKNAEYKVTDTDVRITEEVIGRQIDMIEAATAIEALLNGETVELKIVRLMPEVTLAELEEKLFNHTLAKYTTAYSTKDASRSANVELAAEKINGAVLAPGAVFSFNDVVGPRTAEAGFKNAPVYENGETVQGMGGGVCQVSSTLYSAVLYADLEITARQNHSMTVSYVPKGQDATVVYGSIDFKFKNSTEYPIKVIASAGGGKLSIAICGTRPETEKTVKIVNNIISETAPEVRETESRGLNVGERKVISSGKNGYTVSTVRTVFENGAEVKSEKFMSTYKMVPAEIAIGAKVPDPLPALPARATPEPTPSPTPEPEEETAEDAEGTEDAEEAEETPDEGEQQEDAENTEEDPDETPMPTPPVPEGLVSVAEPEELAE